MQRKVAETGRDLDAHPSSGEPAFVRPAVCEQGCRFFMDEASARKSDMDKVGVTMKFVRNETIYSKGDEARHSYKVIEGAVRLSRIFADGRRQIVNFYLPDETFGIELAEEYTSTAEAVGDVVALRCPRACIAQLTEGNPDISQKRLAMLSKSLSAAERHVAMLGHQSAKERVASFFLALEMQRHTDVEGMLDLPLSRQDIADYLGLTIETTCRALSDLKRQKIIDAPSRRRIVIRDLAGLQAIAEGDV
ncbi:MAG: helix-turn-helix domain-containing protein [Alphaproteobacteria bacterium]|nr:helix-turn-helix domain-containing protein [Alphaproteobacteria bacterium]MDE2111241.1 helix-turn-helix domain-containing protein [Alphaproteobacteria bacterium]MDE2492583.1 helix-turn-helix domain-containing protein [Alphaproteobacteria bacterium]